MCISICELTRSICGRRVCACATYKRLRVCVCVRACVECGSGVKNICSILLSMRVHIHMGKSALEGQKGGRQGGKESRERARRFESRMSAHLFLKYSKALIGEVGSFLEYC